MNSHLSRTVLVTGGAGYIGSHTVKALAAAGFEPVIFDDLSTGHAANVDGFTLIQGDICDREAVRAALAEHKPIAVLHFAAKIAVGESLVSPSEYYYTNVFGTWCLLEEMRAGGVNKLIFSSSASVYGMPDVSVASEDTPKNPIHPYGRTKWMTEQMLADYGHAYGLKSVSLRFFNAAGAAVDGTLGNRNPAPTNLIPVAVDVLAGAQEQLKIFGVDYPTPDGTCVRDYVHVDDLADAHVRALTYLMDGGDTTALNLGSHEGHSVKDIVQMLKGLSGLPLSVQYAERRPGDPATLVADARRAKDILGWVPQHSDLRTICQTAWNFRKSLVPPLPTPPNAV
ncbi:MAG: UDP-glucose 4-epimerase GalE [Alphaproteobacteria bacterium CG_4_10_14_0_8_um_filter_53_9]|nr:MAG: UDP-glucose 4-epimerase GalE [Alphaproteobacteria bacterium CG_4_10_14_0_8_um_filter_53_9]